ncbi:unnamed protein product [Mycena citricolor]|uniref:Translation initiation factor eIF2B subunit epsilon n=1 Tax=Mycena citricolor TaxID=2018698 RepID=A0AAD2Q121_9AGAR|nr:unnamed protein product [Mycena citricolor]
MAPKLAAGKEKLIDEETSLALAGVQEIFVICRSHAEQVKALSGALCLDPVRDPSQLIDAGRDSKWSRPGSGIKIVPIMTAKETFSAGDAMRDVYTRGLVTSDFVLVMGDLVSNIRIDEVVRVHKERRKTNKDAIMTMVVKESGVSHRTRTTGDSSVFVLDAHTSECLHYQPVDAHPATRFATIPREVLESHPEIELRNDLIDCSIDICSVEVPSLFQDNFDYEDIRRDFVHGVLTSDLLMKNIYCYVAEDGYAARVKDTKSYDAISKDILSRWTFPLVPDDNHPGGHVYQHSRGNKYFPADNSVTLARSSKIGNNTLIGAATRVHDNVEITGSVIGRNCVIGAGSVIEGAYIFDGTVIGANCYIKRSIVGAGVTIKDKTRIEKGCLVGDGVVVGPLASLDSFERLSKRREQGETYASDDEDSDLEDVENNQDAEIVAALGKDSNALNQRTRRLGDDGSELEYSDDGSDDDDDSSDESDSDEELNYSGSEIEVEVPGASNLMQDKEFTMEVNQSLERAFAEGHSVDNAAVELKTLRMASNVPLSRVREAVIAAIVEAIPVVEGAAAQRREISRVISRWGPLINKIGGIDAVEAIGALQGHCSTSTRLPMFGHILADLYQIDVVDEDHILAWHALVTSKGLDSEPNAENVKRCWIAGGHLLKQLQEQESDEEDEDGEDKEEDEGKASISSAKEGSGSSEDESSSAAEGSESGEEESESGEEGSSDSEEGSGDEESDEESSHVAATPPASAPALTPKADAQGTSVQISGESKNIEESKTSGPSKIPGENETTTASKSAGESKPAGINAESTSGEEDGEEDTSDSEGESGSSENESGSGEDKSGSGEEESSSGEDSGEDGAEAHPVVKKP